MENERESSVGPVRRRRLLRAGGAAVAGVVGAGVVSAVAASPAQAAPGDPLSIGNPNSGGTSSTALTTSSLGNGTLALANSAGATDAFGTKYAGAPLVLTPHPDAAYVDGPIGSLGASTNGNLYTVDEFGATFIRTGNNSMEVFATTPTRLLDTRDPAGRGNILNPAALLAGAGVNGYRLKAGTNLNLDLSAYLNFGDAIFATITVVNAGGAGHLVAFPYNTSRPNAATINYPLTSAVSTFSITKIGFDNTVDNAITLWSTQLVHVIVDAVAATVPSLDNLAGSFAAAGAKASGRAARAATPKRSFSR